MERTGRYTVHTRTHSLSLSVSLSLSFSFYSLSLFLFLFLSLSLCLPLPPAEKVLPLPASQRDVVHVLPVPAQDPRDGAPELQALALELHVPRVLRGVDPIRLPPQPPVSKRARDGGRRDERSLVEADVPALAAGHGVGVGVEHHEVLEDEEQDLVSEVLEPDPELEKVDREA